MTRPKLSARLALAASLVPRDAVLADVGTDHGYVPAALLAAGAIKRAVATDINPGPLSRARRTAAEYGVAERMEFLLCDGLAALPPYGADAVLIAGMGGEMMISILSAAPWTRDGAALILQPQSRQAELRRWLCRAGYEITGEYQVRDAGRFYQLMTARGGAPEPYSAAELHVGRLALQKTPAVFAGFLDGQLAVQHRLCEALERSSRPGDAVRLREHRRLLSELENMKRRFEDGEIG